MNAVATETAKKEVFRVNDMNLWYGQHHALKHIDLAIREHEVTAIIYHPAAESQRLLKR